MQVISAAREVSDPGGRLFQPEGGRVRPQIFFRRHNSKQVSKSCEETEDLEVGYSFPHWEVHRTLFFRSVAIWHGLWDQSELHEGFLVDIPGQRSPLAQVIQLQQEGNRAEHNLSSLWQKDAMGWQKP